MLCLSPYVPGINMDTLASVVQPAFALLLGYVFFVAGYHKLKEQDRFVQIIRDYDVIPDAAPNWVEQAVLYLLGMIEVTIFVLLLSPYSHYSALAATALLAFYTVVMGRSLILGKRLKDCGCGLPDQEGQVSGWLIVRNMVLVAVAISLVSVRQEPSLVWLISIPLAMCLVGLYVIVAQLHQNQIKLNILRVYRG